MEGALDEAAAGAAVAAWGLEPKAVGEPPDGQAHLYPCGVAHDRLHPGGGRETARRTSSGRTPEGCRTRAVPSAFARYYDGSGSTLEGGVTNGLAGGTAPGAVSAAGGHLCCWRCGLRCPSSYIVAVILVLRHCGERSARYRAEDEDRQEPKFHGPVYTVDYKEVGRRGPEKDEWQRNGTHPTLAGIALLAPADPQAGLVPPVAVVLLPWEGDAGSPSPSCPGGRERPLSGRTSGRRWSNTRTDSRCPACEEKILDACRACEPEERRPVQRGSSGEPPREVPLDTGCRR